MRRRAPADPPTPPDIQPNSQTIWLPPTCHGAGLKGLDFCQQCRSRKHCARRLAGAAPAPVRPPAAPDPTTPPTAPTSRLRNSWRGVAKEWSRRADLAVGGSRERLLAGSPRHPPWLDTVHVSFVTSLPTPTHRSDDPEIRRLAALEMLSQLPPATITANTDGAAKGGTRNGGAGAEIVGCGLTETLRAPAGAQTSSFRAECVALVRCLECIRDSFLPRLTLDAAGAEIRICTDSRSALTALMAGPAGQRHLVCQEAWSILQECAAPGPHFTLAWVPSHCGLAGNEAADEAARLGGLEDQVDAPVDLPSAKAAIRAVAKREARLRFEAELPPTHHYRKVCDGRPLPRDPTRTSQEARALQHLRVNRHPACRTTLARWGKLDDDGHPVTGECLWCPCVNDDAEHLICACDRWAVERKQWLGVNPLVSLLHTAPTQVCHFLRAIGLLPQPPI